MRNNKKLGSETIDSSSQKFKKFMIVLLGSNISSLFIVEIVIQNVVIFSTVFALLTWLALVLFSFIPHPRYLDRFIYLPITLLFCIACGIGLGMWIKDERKVKIMYGLITAILCFVTIFYTGYMLLTEAGFS